MNDFREEKKHMGRLKYVLMGINRIQGQSHVRPVRPPITWDRLNAIISFIHHTESGHNQAMLSAAILLSSECFGSQNLRVYFPLGLLF